MIKTIKIKDLRLGMYIQELHGSWIDHPFWKTRFLLTEKKDFLALRSCGIPSLSIDISKGLDVATSAEKAAAIVEENRQEEAEATQDRPDPEAAATPENPPQRAETGRVGMAEEIRKAQALCDHSRQAVIDMFTDVRMGNAINVSGVQDMVEDISASVARNPDALITLARLKTADDYTYMHSVAVCALMIALARQLGLDENQVREAGVAGLLHDTGKMCMPPEVLNKPGKLTDAEFNIMKGHPQAGHDVLVACNELSPGALEVCLHHHEKMDGSGYPARLAGEEISLLAKMGAVCDVYDAITSNRPYKKGWGPADSIHQMAQWCDTHFDRVVFQAFVKSVGIYPVGSLVRLQSERLGVVLEQHEHSLLTPRVKVFFSASSRMAIPQQIVDLSQPGTVDRIVGRESIEHWGFANIEQLWLAVEGK
ncbi:MAG: HD-GYP domain-containing protein [Pseudomonadales bacterium]|nr:HD-GYP domain-containing protein [Pseudomonadales bacterium]